ncbi:S24 family peptidase [Cronobacter sakazakii]
MQHLIKFEDNQKTPTDLVGNCEYSNFGTKVQHCVMNGDSMYPTIAPCEVVAFIACGGSAMTPGIYVYSRDVFGRTCMFIKRIEPLPDGSLRFISDNHFYKTFTLEIEEQKDLKIHGKVMASLAVRYLA